MKKNVKALLLSLMLALPALASCQKGNDRTEYNLDNAVYNPLPEIGDDIDTIKIEGVPTTPIEIGYIAYAGIKLRITYRDGSSLVIPFTENLLPADQFPLLKTPGRKNVDFLFRGNHLNFDIDLIEAAVPMSHKVTFLNKDDGFLYETIVPYLGMASYSGPNIPDYVDADYYYTWAKDWDRPVDLIYHDLSVHPVYDRTEIRDYANKYDNTGHLPVLAQRADVSDWDVLFYLGEVENIELYSTPAIYHDEDSYDVLTSAAAVDDSGILNLAKNKIRDIMMYRYSVMSSSQPVCGFTVEQQYCLSFDVSYNPYGFPNAYMPSLSDSYEVDFVRFDGRAPSRTPFHAPIDDYVAAINTPTTMPIYYGMKAGYYRLSYVIDLDAMMLTHIVNFVGRRSAIEKNQFFLAYVENSGHYVFSYSETANFPARGESFRVSVADFEEYYGQWDSVE